MDGELWILAAVLLITLCASCLQSITGFGFGILAMIFLPSVIAYTEANDLSTVLISLTSLCAVAVTFNKVSWKNVVFPVIGCILSTYFAVAFIKTQENETLKLLLGVALFLLSVYFFFWSGKIKIKPTWYAGLIAGALSGIMGGLFSIGGPPVVVYFLQSEEDSEHYLGSISAYFVLSGIVSVASKAIAGFVTERVLLCIAVGVFGMLLGSFTGKRARDKINSADMKKAVYGFMAISGKINIVASAIAII